MKKMNFYIDILNRDCKTTNHGCCPGCWEGYGIEVYCNCLCHHYKKNNVKSDGFGETLITFNIKGSKSAKDPIQTNKEAIIRSDIR